jgi:hypothetical protein
MHSDSLRLESRLHYRQSVFPQLHQSERPQFVPVLIWAGEHFLHSCLLLIQVLIVAFARDYILGWEWVTHYSWLKIVVTLLFNVPGVFMASTAAWCWYWAFDELNKELWANWRHRIEKINRQRDAES